MRILAVLVLICLPAVAADVDLEALQEETRVFLDSRIGVVFPDVQLRVPGEKKALALSEFKSNEGVLVLYSNSQCRHAIRAAGFLAEVDWKWHGLPVIVVHPKWRKNKYARRWMAELPDGTPLFQLRKSDPPDWLVDVRVAPMLFLLDDELRVRDWSVAVPGKSKEVPIVSRLGSRLVVQPPD